MSQAFELSPKSENLDCIHCGMCLSSCPTYTKVWSEADSPRGRIHLITAAGQGKIPMDETFRRHIDLCLGCRACESACPSGVQFEHLLTAARSEMEKLLPRGRLQTVLRDLGFRHLLPHPKRLHAFFRLIRWMQKLPAGWIKELLPQGSAARRALEQLESLPPIDPGVRILSRPQPAGGTATNRAAFFRGCVMNEIYFPAQVATLRVLEAAACAVEIPEGQTCCGALHEHNGEREQARELAWRNIQAFASSSPLPVITNSAGCGALLKRYDRLFDSADGRRAAAGLFSTRVRDFSEFLAGRAPDLPLGPVRARVTYDDPCHLIHGQKISQPPRVLLQRIPGVQYVELNHASWCCGSAGTYSLTQPEMAALIQRDKTENILAAGVEAVVTANPGCMLQIKSGLRKAGSKIEVLHLAEILDRSIRSVPVHNPGDI